jgi:hypothetical protein
MKVGDLVKITQARLGVPENTVGLIIKHHGVFPEDPDLHIFIVQLLEPTEFGARPVRRLSRDLEVISESR